MDELLPLQAQQHLHRIPGLEEPISGWSPMFKRMGMVISPPPPAIESTKPAASPVTNSRGYSQKASGEKSIQFCPGDGAQTSVRDNNIAILIARR